MEESFGVIPFRKRGGHWEIFLVHHQKGHWGFPKGHADPGESPQAAAQRELYEETSLEILSFIQDEPLHDHYTTDKGPKRVTYFLANVTGNIKLQEAEIQDGRWLSPDEAEKLITFTGPKALLTAALRCLHPPEMSQ